jgi:hypothetical protein
MLMNFLNCKFIRSWFFVKNRLRHFINFMIHNVILNLYKSFISEERGEIGGKVRNHSAPRLSVEIAIGKLIYVSIILKNLYMLA